MGRGRAKAKQTKVARELKYSSPSTDFASLQRELSGSSHNSQRSGVLSDEHDANDSRSRWEEDEDHDDWRR
ncbi:DUF3073 domain-containing protein [Nocardia terpenica]|uniref:DUF3073 domain-containing protein n=1 Tax=Nocardia terpenica TaxID=455432 RepID=A0A164HXG6_9NOCA|nr:DUF3073 domain-containing protein [Nocardia terpenica]ATL65465.1 DUF3073 domain-containing protein [Nocardia terpenica]KZM68905.1 hypothetical protein AWN90_14080 [Nocardia terpenica]MBF6062273.1 DUF3073 domain-containing protein [Nocardia terpenica]MBF6104361.1 DUF3073 domain-containing protein [Nocardia terpenica]MBF6109783.1 DUF3073 domain-containing protein [Nocardia terpenica]